MQTPPYTLFLCGDVMTGRGIDQALPCAAEPTLHEPVITNARSYLTLALQRAGELKLPVDYEYIWGDALDVLAQVKPVARIINLETAITTSDDWDRDKGIHYRMHPQNVSCLKTARIDVCVLANNHVLDWGAEGLRETLVTLQRAKLKFAGAGLDDEQAEAAAVIDLPGAQRVLVFAFAMPTSGVPRGWAATPRGPGVNYLPNLSQQSTARVIGLIKAEADPGDLIVFSVHWGGNWGYAIPDEQINFAHRLVDEAGVDVVQGHSSHHVLGFEIYEGRPILYGCGDFLNDYEGITGHEAYRPDLTLMYFPTLDPAMGALRALRLAPMQIRNLRLNRAGAEDARWLRDMLNRESRRFGVRVELDEDGMLRAANIA